MRVGELSRRSGVSVPSIKFYLREGLLAPGERTGVNQADYGEVHLRRLRLVRALLDVGGLSVAAAREVLGAVDDDRVELHDALGAAQTAVNPVPGVVDDESAVRARATVDALIDRRSWQVAAKNPGVRAAADVLASFDRLGWAELGAALDVYADAAETVARAEVDAVVAAGVAAGVTAGDRERTVEGAVTGIVLGGALLAALRTMAQEDASARLLEPADGPSRG